MDHPETVPSSIRRQAARGPAREIETILYADVARSRITGPRWQLDVAGHYGADIFRLSVDRRARPMVAEAQEAESEL